MKKVNLGLGNDQWRGGLITVQGEHGPVDLFLIAHWAVRLIHRVGR